MNKFALTESIKNLNAYMYKHLPDEMKNQIGLPIKEFDISKIYAIEEFISKGMINKSIKYMIADYHSATNSDFSISHNPKKYNDIDIYKYTKQLKNVSYGIDVHLNSEYNSKVLLEVVDILSKNDKFSCLVGGAVRDIVKRVLTGVDSGVKDYDFVSSLPYERLRNIFENHGFTVNETGKKFLVMMVSKGGEDFEIANFRKDGTYTDGRRPESVSIGTLWDDAERRDLTVNCLYFGLADGILIDPTGKGLIDMENNTLRFVGNPEQRIEEDSLRVFRFYRFVSKGYKPEKRSLSAARKGMETALKSTPERVVSEIERMVGL